MDKLAVHQYMWKGGWQIFLQAETGLRNRRSRRVQNVGEQRPQVGLFQIEFHRFRKIQERLHSAIQPVDLIVEHLDGLLRFRLNRHVSLEDLEPQAHRVQWILHLVRHAGCHAPQSRQTLGHLELAADALERFDVSQSHQRPHSHAVLANHLHAYADSLWSVAALEGHLFAFARLDLVALDFQHAAKRMTRRKDFRQAPASQLRRFRAEEFLYRWADKNRTTLGIE